MIKKLINPFEYIAGSKSLFLGLCIILITSLIGHYSSIHFPDIISVKTSYYLPLLYYIIQGASNWLIMSSILYVLALIFSKSAVRLIDIFGTQALARFPYAVAALTGFSGSINRVGQYISYTMLGQGKAIELSAYDLPIAISLIVLSLVLLVWMITLMLNAFKISANLRGGKLAISFIIGFVLSMIASSLFSIYLIKSFT